MGFLCCGDLKYANLASLWEYWSLVGRWRRHTPREAVGYVHLNTLLVFDREIVALASQQKLLWSGGCVSYVFFNRPYSKMAAAWQTLVRVA